MARPNFNVINARGIYAFSDYIKVENEDGKEVEVLKECFDWEALYDALAYRGKEDGFSYPSEDWNNSMAAREICETPLYRRIYGKGNAWTTNTYIKSLIAMRDGHYGGSVLDYDVTLESENGCTFSLSEYDGNTKDMLDDYLSSIEDYVDYKGASHKWNIGTFKMHKANIRKWVEGLLNAEIEKCEKFCKDNCEMELCVSARFSNGETWYDKVG